MQLNTQRSTFNTVRSRGVTLFEIVVVALILSILGGVAANRFFYYQERAEKAAMDANLSAFRMGLRIRMAELIANNRTSELKDLLTENPVRWLEKPPPGWAGEYHAPGESENWYYASATHELIYVPHDTSYLEEDTTASDKALRFRIVHQYDETGGSPADIALEPVIPYKWF